MSSSSTQMLSPGGAPPLDLEGASPAQLRDLCKGLYGDLTFLSGVIPGNISSVISTAATGAAAVLAGVFDGAMKENNKIGPVAITTVVAVGAALSTVFVKNADWRELGAAVARGVGAPLLYEWSRGNTTDYMMKRKLNKAADAGAPKAISAT